MARLPNGALVISKRTEQQVYNTLGDYQRTIALVMDSPGELSKEDQDGVDQFLQQLQELREKFSGK